jgi:hypothetical protein
MRKTTETFELPGEEGRILGNLIKILRDVQMACAEVGVNRTRFLDLVGERLAEAEFWASMHLRAREAYERGNLAGGENSARKSLEE